MESMMNIKPRKLGDQYGVVRDDGTVLEQGMTKQEAKARVKELKGMTYAQSLRLRLNPNKEQASRLSEVCDNYKFLYNFALQTIDREVSIPPEDAYKYNLATKELKAQLKVVTKKAREADNDEEKATHEAERAEILDRMEQIHKDTFDVNINPLLSQWGKNLVQSMEAFCPDLPSGSIAAVKQKVTAQWKQYRYQLLTGECAGIQRHSDRSFSLSSVEVRLFKNPAGTFAKIKVSARKSNDVLEDKDMYIVLPFSFSHKNPMIESAVSRLIELGNGVTSSPTISKRGRKWFLSFSVELPVRQNELVDERILNVYIPGEGDAFLEMAPSNDLNRKSYLESDSALHMKRGFEARRKKMNRSYYNSTSGSRVGHGRKRALKGPHRITEKFENSRRTWNQQRAAVIVKEALKHQCSSIHMTDLCEAKLSDLRLGDWSYYEFMDFVEKAAKKEGIAFKKTKAEKE